MKAEILSVGTELLLGDITNTNAQYLARQLAGLGIGVYFQTVVGDNAERLLSAFQNAFARAELVITTGGLGPTPDDLTKETAARYFGVPMRLDEPSLKQIQVIFSRYSAEDMPKSNEKQAYLPAGGRPLPNANGTAPGCIVEKDGKTLIVLPGPPVEMTAMFENEVLPFLRGKQEATFVSRTLRLSGIGESLAAERIGDLLTSQNPTVAPYAKEGEVALRITAKAVSTAEAEALIAPMAAEIYKRFDASIYGENEDTLESAVVRMLAGRKLTVAVAESCTGGLVTARLVNVPGVSAVLREGLVTYTNESKVKRLGVKPETLARYGAVSKETAMEMAAGLQNISGADIALATTGVAGPDGGTDEKPVGLVYLGLCIRGRTQYKQLSLTGNREKIRNRTAAVLLEWLRQELGCYI